MQFYFLLFILYLLKLEVLTKTGQKRAKMIYQIADCNYLLLGSQLIERSE